MDARDIPKNIARNRHENEMYKNHTLYIKGDTWEQYCFATLFRVLREHIGDDQRYLDEVFYLLDMDGNWFNHKALIADLQDLFGGYFKITMHLSGYRRYRWIKIVAKDYPHWSFIWGGLYLMLTILREMDSMWMNTVWRFFKNPAKDNKNRFTTWLETMTEFTIKRPTYDIHNNLQMYAGENYYSRDAISKWIKDYLKTIKKIWGTKRVWSKDSKTRLANRNWNGIYQTLTYNFFVGLLKDN